MEIPSDMTKSADHSESDSEESVSGPGINTERQPESDPQAKDDTFPFPLEGVDLSSVSDEKLLECFSTAPRLHDFCGVKVARISKTLVIKGGDIVALSEAETTTLAAQSLHLRVPKVYRTFSADVPDAWGQTAPGHLFVMDYVPGPTVEECWDSLGQVEREAVALQVANMIDAMQSRTLDDMPPGPIGESGDDSVYGPWFGGFGAGPFATVQELENWCNHCFDISSQLQQVPPGTPRFKFHDLVLTHQDIAPRNLILDSQGKVWLIDWGCAGAYPRGFEQAAFCEQCVNEELREMVLSRLSDRQEALTSQYRAISGILKPPAPPSRGALT